MNSPLKNKIKKFSRLDEEFQSKLELINSITQNKSKHNSKFLSSWITMHQKIEEKPYELGFKHFININFEQSKQKTVIVREKSIVSNLTEGKMFVIMIETNVQLNATLLMNWNGYEKKMNYKVEGIKAIPLDRYFKEDVKLILSNQTIKSTIQVRLHLDIIKSQFQSGKKLSTISPKKQKQLIVDFLKQNRGRSAQILLRRSMSQSTMRKQRFISSAASKNTSTNNFYNPASNFANKKDKSELNLFELQKTKYLNHMKKMCSQKDSYLKKTQDEYITKKEQQLNQLTSLVLLSKFYQKSRLKLLEKMNDRMKKIKTTMLATDFCMLMKSKLRFKITQKARYRMAIRTPLAFLGQIFHQISKPKAQLKVLNSFEQIQSFKTLLKLSKRSVAYLQKVKIIQKYAKKKTQNIRQRVSILMDQLMAKHKIKETELKIKRKDLIQKYLKMCRSESNGSWTIGIYRNRNALLQMITG